MYSIEVRNKSGTYAVYNPYDEDITVMEASLDLEINKSGTLTFSLAQSHPNIGQIIPLASEIYVWDDSKLVWIGRPIEIQTDFSETRTVTCEGVLGYLLDSQMPAFDYTEGNSKTVRAFLVAVLNNHNTAVKKTGYANAGLNKTFNIGTVTVTDSNNNIARSAEDYNSSMEIINTRLISPLGGILRARWSADGSTRYIDYLDGVGDAGQDVIFGENLLDLSKHLKSDTIITALYPKGASNEDGTNLTLAGYAPASSVVVSGISKNKADAYIWSPSAVNKYGYIYGTAEWEDVTLVQNLYTKSAEYLKAASVMGTTIELSAVDLSRISVEYSRFEVGQMVNVVSIPHDVNAPYQLTRMKINLLNPADSDLVLGGELKTFTFENTKSQMERDLKVASEITDAVQTATSLISGGLGGHVILKPNSEGRPEEILIMDTADIATAKKLWRWNLGGLGYSSNGYGGPYGTAITMDGAIVADYIKTGTLNANIIKAGMLSDANNNTKFNLSTGELNINKGSLSLGGGNFSVNDSGVVTIKKGSINLGGNFIVTDAGVLTMKKGSINLGSGNFKVTDAGLLTMKKGSISLGGKFSVTDSGTMTAKAGEIGPWTIQSTGLIYNGDGYDSYFRRDSLCVGKKSGTLGRLIIDNGYFRISPDRDSDYAIYGSNDPQSIMYGVFMQSPSGSFIGVAGGDATVSGGSTASLKTKNGNGRLDATSSGLTIVTGRQTTSHSGNLYITTTGTAYYANEGGSSRKIKHDIGAIESPELDPARLYDLDVIQFVYNDDIAPEGDENHDRELPGFIVEDLEEIYPAAVQKEPDDPEESKNWTWSPTRLIPPMLQLIQEQHREIEDLKRRIK